MINTRKEHDYWDPKRTGFVTNYPNFLHWKQLAAEQMEDNRPVNIYVHTPYCIQRCAYCYYKTVNLHASEKQQRMERYVHALCREIELASEHYRLRQRPVVSVYFGGGTPTLLDQGQIERITATLRENFNIDTPEFTVEAEPVTLSEGKAKALKDLEVNRISMGVQSFNDEIIKRSNRLDNERKALKAIHIAKSTEAVINIDLMSGLAGETPETWAHSVERAISTEVESITVYKTELYTNTPYYKDIRNQELTLPSETAELEFMQYAIDQLEGAGYRPWSFYTYAKPGGHQHVYATSTFMGDDCYAFGVSAFGKLGDTLFQNTNDEHKYIELLESDQLPIMRGHLLSSLDKMIREVVLGMKLVRFDLRRFQQRHGFRLEALCASTLEQLVLDDFIALSDDEITLTAKGILHGDYTGKSLARSLLQN
ncbi:MAG: coproporphyrinogen-III oxidase family protein [Methylococcales bacterium]